jgi:hypothetical protein
MPSLTCRLTEKFILRNIELEQTRSMMEDLLTKGQIKVQDIEQVYAGLYLSVFTEFEGVLEALFFGLLSGTLRSKKYSIKCKVKIKPVAKTQDVVFGGRSYLDWLPYGNRTIPRANQFFDGGKPFTLILKPQLDNLEDYYSIRNALAHKSNIARKKFEEIINGLTLLPQEKTPTGYLRSKPSSASPRTQYEIAVTELEYIATTLCS